MTTVNTYIHKVVYICWKYVAVVNRKRFLHTDSQVHPQGCPHRWAGSEAMNPGQDSACGPRELRRGEAEGGTMPRCTAAPPGQRRRLRGRSVGMSPAGQLCSDAVLPNMTVEDSSSLGGPQATKHISYRIYRPGWT